MRKITAWTPLVLTVLGFAGLGSLAVYRLMHMPSAGTQVTGLLFASIYLIWMSRESRISVAEISKPEADHDRGTMELAAVVKILLLIAALAPPSSLLSDRYALAAGIGGIVLVVSGASLRLSTIRALGDSYSHRIRSPRIPLVSSGPYAWMRHPAYVGTVLIHAGVVFVFTNPFSLATLALWIAAVWVRTICEERHLMQFSEYRIYRKAVTGAWLPRQAMQSALPLMLSITFILLISILSSIKLAGMPRPLAVALGAVSLLYLAWLLIESRIAVKEVSKQTTRIDRGTCELYASMRAAVVLTALALPTRWDTLGVWYPVGLAIFTGSVVLRLSAIQVLGRFYSHRVRLADSHQIVARGPYRIVRHPAYTGMIGAHLGFVLCFFNCISLAIVLFLLVPAVVLRIGVEERALYVLEGYPEYARMRRRLVPLLW
jgi:protein-S-isoprenylcysteine O-methyltransferase Ste14